MKNRVKEFLQPTKGKVITAIALLILFLSFRSVQVILGDPPAFDTFFGFPLPYYRILDYPISWDGSVRATRGSWILFPFGLFALFVDVIFWYVISCFTVIGYDRVRGKRK
jgi:hypothetical protein